MEVHIIAHNAEEYRDALQSEFPELNYHVAHNRHEIPDHVDQADIMMTFGTQTSDALFTKTKKLKWVQALGTGVDGITDQPSLRSEIIVTSMRGIHGPQMAEMAILMMLSHSRHLPWSIRNQDKANYARRPGMLLEGKTVGILGIGVIAEALAARLRTFGTRNIGLTTRPRDLPNFDEMVAREDLLNVVGDFDFLVLLIPYTEETEKIINQDVLAAMKSDAYLVNLARGEIIDDKALITALESGEIGGAALDVFWEEPLPDDHPYWTTKNVLITPHHGGMVEEYGGQAIPLIVHNMRCFLNDKAGEMKNLIER